MQCNTFKFLLLGPISGHLSETNYNSVVMFIHCFCLNYIHFIIYFIVVSTIDGMKIINHLSPHICKCTIASVNYNAYMQIGWAWKLLFNPLGTECWIHINFTIGKCGHVDSTLWVQRPDLPSQMKKVKCKCNMTHIAFCVWKYLYMEVPDNMHALGQLWQ